MIRLDDYLARLPEEQRQAIEQRTTELIAEEAARRLYISTTDDAIVGRLGKSDRSDFSVIYPRCKGVRTIVSPWQELPCMLRWA